MTRYADTYKLWNDLFPFGPLLLRHFWVLEGIDDDNDGIIEGANRREFGHALAYRVETAWEHIQDCTHRCHDGTVIRGKCATFTARVYILSPLLPFSATVSATLQVYAENCPDGGATRGQIVEGDLREWLSRR